MNVLRTPDEQFEDLPGFPFVPHYLTADGLRIHYVDEGPRDAEIVLMMHGEPSWSFLYRHMIPSFVGAGYRAMAPDLVGFGRSDKPADRKDYTYQRHVDWMRSWMVALGLQRVTLVCQNWGSLIGLRLVTEHSERFSRVVLANGGLPTGDRRVSTAFESWLQFSQRVPRLPVGRIINMGTKTNLSRDVRRAYDAPFPEESYKEGARIFPALVPITPDDAAAEPNRRAWKMLVKFDKPFLTAFSDGDPITRGADRYFRKLVPGAAGQPHTIIEGAGHFLQEDKGPELAQVVLDFMAQTPLRIAL